MLLRRAVFLLLGAVVLLPYALAAAVLVQAVRSGDPGGLITALVALTAAAVPPFLAGTRELEIAATRALLGTGLPPAEPGRPALETRLRAALWFGLHLVTGGVVAAALVVAVPLALLAVTERLGITRGQLGGDRWLWTGAGVALLAGTFYATKWLGALAHAMAPVLLGPSPAEREAALAARERALAERNRLARELHDSVGHALTATTLQAGAARQVFDRDPEFARRALGAIEELGRTALDELDAVLGVLRDDAAGVVLMDVRMPGVDGIQATRLLLDRVPDPPRVLVLTTFENDEYVYEALRAGAGGFLLKRARPAQIVEAVRVVGGGESLLFPAAVRRLAAAYGPAGARLPGTRLTEREAEVLALMADGLSNAEIAGRLFLGVETVKTHVGSILGKLGVRDRTQAVVVAYRSGFISP